MIDPVYRAQVELLLRVLPFVARVNDFALHGGTAINLFERDLPRLSVDIDLTYLRIADRDGSLQAITDHLKEVQEMLGERAPDINVALQKQGDGAEAKLICRAGGAQIKVEVNTVKRGTLLSVRDMTVSDAVQDEFGMFAAMQVVSHGELFGGKIHAALDRQHPRDLFDVAYLLNNEGLTDDVRHGMVAALVSSPRPLHELLKPNFINQRQAFENQFAGMSAEPFTYEDFEAARERLLAEISNCLTDEDKAFMLSVMKGEPEWSLFPWDGIEQLPAVQWKIMNINKLKEQNPDKFSDQIEAMNRCLEVEVT